MVDDIDHQTQLDLGLAEPSEDTIPDWEFEGFWLGNEALVMFRALKNWGVTYSDYMAQPREYWDDMFTAEAIYNTRYAVNWLKKKRADDAR